MRVEKGTLVTVADNAITAMQIVKIEIVGLEDEIVSLSSDGTISTYIYDVENGVHSTETATYIRNAISDISTYGTPVEIGTIDGSLAIRFDNGVCAILHQDGAGGFIVSVETEVLRIGKDTLYKGHDYIVSDDGLIPAITAESVPSIGYGDTVSALAGDSNKVGMVGAKELYYDGSFYVLDNGARINVKGAGIFKKEVLHKIDFFAVGESQSDFDVLPMPTQQAIYADTIKTIGNGGWTGYGSTGHVVSGENTRCWVNFSVSNTPVAESIPYISTETSIKNADTMGTIPVFTGDKLSAMERIYNNDMANELCIKSGGKHIERETMRGLIFVANDLDSCYKDAELEPI